MHLHFLLLVKTINILFLFIIFNLYQNPEISRGGEYRYSDFKIARPKRGATDDINNYRVIAPLKITFFMHTLVSCYNF